MKTFRESFEENERDPAIPRSDRSWQDVHDKIHQHILNGVEPSLETVHRSKLRATQAKVSADRYNPLDDEDDPDHAFKRAVFKTIDPGYPVGLRDRSKNVHILDGHNRADKLYRAKKSVEMQVFDEKD